MKYLLVLVGLVIAASVMPGIVAAADAYYTEPPRFRTRPSPGQEHDLGPIGVTGIKARIHKGVLVTVEGTEPGTPAEGKFEKGEIIVGVNGQMLKGRNPLVVLGNALADSADGKLVFDVVPVGGGKPKGVPIQVPALGSYSETWPLKCRRSERIIKQAADFYANDYSVLKQGRHHLNSGYAILFLLSTGDDRYLPRVKKYFAQFLNEDGSAKKVAGQSWHQGPNGVACAEYYLRTGDRAVLPLLQHYVDDARDRQRYGVGWGHWGGNASSAYEGGGGMQHSAGSLILMTLVLGKACGVDVDETTLIGALRHWYRFVGHGLIPTADHRPPVGSNGASKDGLTAAIMHVASQTQGDATIYKKAKAYLARTSITTLPARTYTYWDLIGQGFGMGFMLDQDPGLYRQTMTRNRWMYELGRRSSGGFVQGGEKRLDPMGCGLALAFAYTAPMKKLYINGARSQYAKEFKLPEHLWGSKADLAFLDTRHHKDFSKYGTPESDYLPFFKDIMPSAGRSRPGAYKELSLEKLRMYVRHYNFSVRNGAARVMQLNGHHNELEKLLNDADPRLRRAALDGINDHRVGFGGPGFGERQLATEKYTPAMCESITRILNDPEEAWFVTEAALFALHNAPHDLIEKNLTQILRWKDSEEWWMRDAAFSALLGFRTDEAKFVKYLPTIMDIMIKEYPYNPRQLMTSALGKELQRAKPGSRVRQVLVAGFTRAARETAILPNVRDYNRSDDGGNNLKMAVDTVLNNAPEAAPDVAEALVQGDRLKLLSNGILMQLLRDQRRGNISGIIPASEKISGSEKERLDTILYDSFRPELITRYSTWEKRHKVSVLNRISQLSKLKNKNSGWQPIGTPEHAERVWRFRSFNPEQEGLSAAALKSVTLLPGMKEWTNPEFDDSRWQSGKAPIGKGVFRVYGTRIRRSSKRGQFYRPNNSNWGEGEVLAMRTEIIIGEAELKNDLYRVFILSPHECYVYLNGRGLGSFSGGKSPEYRSFMISPTLFRKGKNTLAVYARTMHFKEETFSQIDVYFDALNESDLLSEMLPSTTVAAAPPSQRTARTLSEQRLATLDRALLSTLVKLREANALGALPLKISITRAGVVLTNVAADGTLTFGLVGGTQSADINMSVLQPIDRATLALLVAELRSDSTDAKAMAGVYMESLGNVKEADALFEKAGDASRAKLEKLFD